jgi:hypothetical protein
MTWWQWVVDFRNSARAAGDVERLRLVSLCQEASGSRERDPERTLARFEEGRLLARRLNEPWWALYYQGQVVHLLVHFIRDLRRALDLAVPAVLEGRKPIYEGCPIRDQVQQDLIAVHFCVDPDGYADLVREGLREIEQRLPDDYSLRLHHVNLRRWCAEKSRRPEEHYAAAQPVLALIASDPAHHSSLHYSTFVYTGLCRVHFARGQWQELDETAALAREASQKTGNQVERAASLLWQALGAIHRGDAGEGLGLRRRGVATMERLGVPPTDGYFEALSHGYEWAGDPDAALAVRDRELGLLRRQGRTISEVYCQRERCRLLAARDRLTAADLDAARAAARQLRLPQPHLAELDRYSV